MIKKVNHIAVVVPDLEAAHHFWVEGLGLTLHGVEQVEAEGVEVAFLPVGESEIELICPVDASSGVAKYLEKRGSGMHHICFEVDDIEATLQKLRELEIPLITETPITNEKNTKYAFVHPKGTNGVLVELYELAQK
jgi:methylmalonyl-CoA/ethylmalonyl-CoA epimerase